MRNIIGHKKIFLTISGLLMIAGLVAIFVLGFKPGIDFAGGTLWQLRFPAQTVSREEFQAFFTDTLKLTHIVITADTTTGQFLVRSDEINEADHAKFLGALKAKFKNVDELGFETIGAAIGKETEQKAVTAFILVLVAISLYIAFAFRKVSHPVQSWKYGLITLLTLFHDAVIPAGMVAVLGYILNVEIDVNFIVAILMVMGFSVHDTIVVFDRIRENLRSSNSKASFEELVNASVNQTMARSINTSLTIVLVLVALFLFGAPSLHYFVLTILVGIIVGTYSSIFVASPLLTLWKRK